MADASAFPATRWSRVLAADGDAATTRAALVWLCEAYWQPLRAHVERRGVAREAAEDVVQGFFARLIEKRDLAPERSRGRFRAYLRGAIDHFLANHRAAARADKRGGGADHVALDAAHEPAGDDAVDRAFTRAWAVAVVGRAVDRLAAEGDDAARFAALKPFLVGDGDAAAYAAAGERLGLGANAVKVAVHRLRQRFASALRAEVAETVADAAVVDDELAALRAALAEQA